MEGLLLAGGHDESDIVTRSFGNHTEAPVSEGPENLKLH